jgi:hypothetical protein
VRWVFRTSISLSVISYHAHRLMWTIFLLLNSEGQCEWKAFHGPKSVSHSTGIIHSFSSRWPCTLLPLLAIVFINNFIACVCWLCLLVWLRHRELSILVISVSQATTRWWCFGGWRRGTSVMLYSYWLARQRFAGRFMGCLIVMAW